MRVLIATGLAGAALVSLAACNKPASSASASSAAGPTVAGSAPVATGPQSLPHRKAGLWSQTIVMDGGVAGPAMKICVDDASEARTSLAAQNIPGAKCDPTQVSRNLDGSLSTSTRCDMGADGKTQSSGVIKGDFNAAYTLTVHTNTSGSPAPAMNGQHTMIITGTWTGPCAPDQKGGDIIMANGMKINPLDNATSPPPTGGN